MELCLSSIKLLVSKGFKQYYIGIEPPQPKLECHRLKAFPYNNKVFNNGAEDLKNLKKEELLLLIKQELKMNEEEQIEIFSHFGMDDSILPFR